MDFGHSSPSGPDEPVITELSKTSITVPWSEGKAEDFTELHEALSSGKTENFSAHDQEDCGENKFSESESEEDEAEVEPSPDDHGPRFLWAAQHGLLAEVKRLLDVDKILLKFKDNDGYTALHRSCYSHHPTVSLALLKSGAEIEATTEEDWTPLHSACRWNAYNCVEILLAWGANINAVTHGGQTPLHLAAFCGKSRETLQLLLMHPHINVTSKNCQQDTPRDIALRNENCVELFDLIKNHFRQL